MKSKINFDLNGHGEAVVTARIVLTDDVRDKVAKRFVEGLGYESILCSCWFTNHGVLKDEEGNDCDASMIEIRAVGSGLGDFQEFVSLMGNNGLDKLYEAVKREIKFRERTKIGGRSYTWRDEIESVERKYLPEDSE